MLPLTPLLRTGLRAATLAGAFACALAAALPARATEPGQPAPALRVPGLEGPIDLAQARGKVVYVDFWASWCGPCRQSFPWMTEMQRKYGARGFQVIAVNVDASRQDADRFLAKTPAGFTVGFDASGEAPRRFDVKAMPSSVLIGADGRVVAQHNGFREDERAALEAAIVAALDQPRR